MRVHAGVYAAERMATCFFRLARSAPICFSAAPCGRPRVCIEIAWILDIEFLIASITCCASAAWR
jgi:hypothetical protein